MNLKQRLYLKQFNFLMPLLALLFLCYFTFISPSQALPRWVLIIGLVILGLYTAFKVFLSLLFVKRANQPLGRCFFGTLKTAKPHFALQNKAEEFAALAESFYEVTLICSNQNSALIELERNPHYALTGTDAMYLNALEGMKPNDAGLTELKAMLQTSWKVTDNDSAMTAMQALWQSVLHQEEQMISSIPHFKQYDQCLRDFGYLIAEQDRNVNSAGSELVRFIWLTRACFTLGFIQEPQARNMLRAAAVYLAGNYQTWQQLGYSYLITFIDWAARAKLDVLAYSLVKQRVFAVSCLLNEPTSPLREANLDELRAFILAQGEK
ncbi:DUF1266 domain-containing protein [Pasteurellaceae bacterium HPA106]|uniref:DUF1266 domain-containing protein n=1 Tax=Spirabiliibacterium pneumoniae TaxID=221400 RepID=UPI001AADEBE5|nr:DUF1266 domain-containing protein [Spirabiliibacterium pneumoniae]MBE2896153.1 DUF1266 domain-containing protein [Spirabiliibacterium pneumoniae]